MKDLVAQHKYRKEMMEKNEQNIREEAKISSKFGSFLDSFLVDMLLFIAALTTVIITLVVMYMVCRQSKLKALVANLALQYTKAVEATDPGTRYCRLITNNTFRHNLSCHEQNQKVLFV